MHRIAASIISLLVFVPAPLLQPSSEDLVEYEVSIAPHIVVRGGDVTGRSIVTQAIATFEAAGLRLPNLEVNINSRDRSECNNYRSYWKPGRNSDTIEVCFFDEFTMLHELAHSYVNLNVNDTGRREFMALTPGQVWQDKGVKYNRQGIEDAANTIARGLLRRSPTANADRDLAEATAFDLLVGSSGGPTTDSLARSGDR